MLDALYGKGTKQAFVEACAHALDDPKVTQTDSPDKSVHVEVDWPDGTRLVIDCWPDRVHYSSLQVAHPRGGVYRRLVETLPDLFKARGVKVFTAIPADDESDRALFAGGGFERQTFGSGVGLRWEL